MKQSHSVTLLILISLFVFTGCGVSPESKGKSLAKQLNETFEKYLNDRKQAEINFVNNFYPSKFSSRADAFEEYALCIAEIDNKFQAAQDEIETEYNNVFSDLIDRDFGNLEVFKAAYHSALDHDLEYQVEQVMDNTDYPQALLDKVTTIIPSKPDIDKIIQDLSTETITEGFDRDLCWFSEKQRWNLSKFDITDFTIEEVLRDNDKEYIVIASMRLEGDGNAFDARVKISYILPKIEDWTLEYLTSLGLSIVKTHKYDDLVYYEIKDDGWGGVNALFITNKSNVELVVGVEYVAGGDTYRTSVLVSPDKQAQVGGVFKGGNVTSYQVGFVERF